MSHPVTTFRYTGDTPGADTTERTLFSTVDALSAYGKFALCGLRRLAVFCPVSGASTVKFYFSADGGTNWTEDTSRRRTLAADSFDTIDFLVDDVAGIDFKVTHTNDAAAAQTTWGPRITASEDRAPGA